MTPHVWQRSVATFWSAGSRRGPVTGRRRRRRPAVEALESRQLLSVTTVTPIPLTSGTAFPDGVAGGPDGRVWYTAFGDNKIGAIDPVTHAQVESAPLPTPAAGPYGITLGPDGNLWFTEETGNKIGRINPTTMAITESSALSTPNSQPLGITAGPDGNLWFTESASNKIGMINPTTMAISEFPIPTPNAQAYGIAAGPDGNLWFTEYVGNKVGRINPTTHAVAESPALTTANSQPDGIAAGPDGNLWFTEYGNNKVAKISPATMAVTEFTVPTATSLPDQIALGPDGNLWFTEHLITASKVGMVIPTTGGIVDFPIGVDNAQPVGIAAGPDGNVWVADPGGAGAHLAVVNPGTYLSIGGALPDFAEPGKAFGLTVSLHYLTGPVDTAYSGPVTIALVNPGGATLGGTLTATATKGVATFTGLSISQLGHFQLVATTDPLTTAVSPSVTVVMPPTIVAEKLIYAGKKRHQHVVGIELDFSSALDPTRAASVANYILTQSFGPRRRLVTQAVAFQAAYDATAHHVTLTLSGNPKFQRGGQLKVIGVPPGGITDAQGVPLDGGNMGVLGDDGTFVITPKGQGISR